MRKCNSTFCYRQKLCWLFSDTPGGAYASATLYSLIETAKANDLNPQQYLSYIFKKLPQTITEEDLRKLLPYNLTNDDILTDI